MSDPEMPKDADDAAAHQWIQQALLALDGQLGEDGQAVLNEQLAADVEKDFFTAGVLVYEAWRARKLVS